MFHIMSTEIVDNFHDTDKLILICVNFEEFVIENHPELNEFIFVHVLIAKFS